MTRNIALTGGIGTGKSVVAAVFERHGAEVFRADVVAKNLMQTDSALRDALRKTFGGKTYSEDGTLNASWLASQVFADPEKLHMLNVLVHPRVQVALDTAMAACTAPMFVMEAALVYESSLEHKFDYVVVVDAEESMRIQRTIAREHTTEEAVRRRMQFQISQQDKVDAADFVLANNGSVAELEAAAEQLHSILSVLPPRDEADRT